MARKSKSYNRPKPTHYKSLITGKVFSKAEYVNHGFGESVIWRNKKDLPASEYPYTLIRILPFNGNEVHPKRSEVCKSFFK